MRAWALAGLLLVAALTGCLSDGQDLPADGGDAELSAAQAGTPEDPRTLSRPNWTVGQYWTWTSPTLGGEYSYVVTGEADGDWIVDTDSEQMAFFDARTDISFLGPIRKSDLAGSQGDSRVEYFHWPLQENETWTTTWDGVERAIEVVSIEDGVAELEARQDGRLAVTYEYDSDAGWFGDVAFYGPNGTATVEAELTRSGTGFQGEPVRWRLETIRDETGPIAAVPTVWGGSFEVGPNATDVWLQFNATCPSGAVSFGVRQEASEQGWGTAEACPAEVAFTGPISGDDPSGRWSYGMQATSPAADGGYTFVLYVRTLHTVPIGAGR